MKQFRYTLFLLITLSLASLSCERDDICADTDMTTPHLIIRFYDANTPSNLKSVTNLSVRGINEDNSLAPELVTSGNTNYASLDSLVLPLRYDAEGLLNTTTFEFEKNSNLSNSNGSNIDRITISYTPEHIYVSRACGYKSIFNDIELEVLPDSNTWVVNSLILNPTVDNEKTAHISIFH